jgi:hypothetical protein
MDARVIVKDLDGVLGFGINLSQKADKHGGRIIKRMANFVQRSAKVRASVKDRWAASGELSRSIKVERGRGKNELIITASARSALYQEKGFKPHYVSIEHLSERAKRSMENYQRGMARTGTGKGKKGLIFVTKSTPIFEPALDALETRIDKIIDDELSKILR